MLISLIISLLGCGSSAPSPSSTPDGRLCGRAYGSTLDSLDELYTKAGKDRPEAIPKKEYVEACVKMGLSEEQLKCLDPKIASLDESCTKALEPVKDKVSTLAKSLLKKAPKEAKKKEGE